MRPHPPFALQHLRVLHAVASHASITGAAAELGLTQPAVSQGLRELERRLGASLVDRATFELTDAGLAFLPAARDVLDAAERAEDAAIAAPGRLVGALAVGASTTIGSYLLPRGLAAFAQRYPDVAVSLSVGNTADICERVARREVDVGFIEGRCTRAELESSPFATDELVLVVPETHPYASQPSVPVSALHGLALILREAGSGTREVIEAALAAVGVEIRCALCLGHTEAIKTAVAAGLGLTVLSRHTIRAPSDGRLRGVPLTGADLRRPLYRVALRGRPPRAVVHRFLECLDHDRAGARG